MSRDDVRIADKLSSKSWDVLRPTFQQLHSALLCLDETAAAELTTIYVKYKYAPEVLSPVFAVIWLKTARELVIGLAMPPDSIPPGLTPPLPRFNYAPMNAFRVIKQGEEIPADFGVWARIAFEYRKTVA